MNILAIIPARKGSKKFPNKNLAKIGKKSLIELAIDTAKEVKKINNILISSDCQKILSFGKKKKVLTSLRPKGLATDNALIIDTIKYEYNRLKKKMKIDIIVLLEVTSPLRKSFHIEKCIDIMIKRKLDSVATFTESSINPHRTWKIKDDKPYKFVSNSNPWLPRQKLPKAYQLSGVAYVIKPEKIKKEYSSLLFGKSGSYIIDKKYSLDIDDKIDFELINLLVKNKI